MINSANPQLLELAAQVLSEGMLGRVPGGTVTAVDDGTIWQRVHVAYVPTT